MARRYRGNPRDLQIAQSEAYLKYGPQRAALAALVRQAQQNRRQDVAAAKAGARATIRGARRARTPTAEVYDAATEAAKTAASDVQTAFGNLGAAADPFAAVTAREQGAALTRIAAEKASSLNELKQRKQEARGGRALAVNQARATYRSDLGEIQQKLLDLGDQEGAYTVGRLASLGGTRAQNRQAVRLERIEQRGRERLEGIKHENDLIEQAAKDRAKRTGPGGRKPATRAEERAFTTDFSRAVRVARQLKAGGNPRSLAADTLITGQGARGEPDYVPSIDDQVALSAALDLVYNGVIQADTAKRIRRVGIRPRILPGENTIAEQLRRAERLGIGQP